MVYRLRVKEVVYEDLEPLECAIDLLDSRINAIEAELQIRPPNTKTLQIVLQGSIMLRTLPHTIALILSSTSSCHLVSRGERWSTCHRKGVLSECRQFPGGQDRRPQGAHGEVRQPLRVRPQDERSDRRR